MENATSDHIPSHGWLAAPKEKMRRAPSSRIARVAQEHPRRLPHGGNLGQAFGVLPDAIDLTYPSTSQENLTYPSTSQEKR
jgi:hypothetical protein